MRIPLPALEFGLLPALCPGLLSAQASTPAPIPATAPPAATREADFTILRDQLVESLRRDIASRSQSHDDLNIRYSLAQAVVAVLETPPPDTDLPDTSIQQWKPQVIAQGSKESADLAVIFVRMRAEQAEAREARKDAKLTETGKRIAKEVFQAKTAKDLELLLDELPGVQPRTLSPAFSTTPRTPNKFLTLQIFVSQWQAQLAERESGQYAMALQTLARLSENSYSPWLENAEIRSQVEAAIAAIRKAAGSPSDEELQAWASRVAKQALAATKPEQIDSLLAEAYRLKRLPRAAYGGTPLLQLGTHDSSILPVVISFMESLQDLHMAARDHQAEAIKQATSKLASIGEDSLRTLNQPRTTLFERILEIQKPKPPQQKAARR